MDFTLPTRDRQGTPLLLRRVAQSEADALFALDNAVVSAQAGMVIDADELSLAKTQAKLKRFCRADHRSALLLGAFQDDALVGTLDIWRYTLRRLRHNGVLTMGVHPHAQGRGIGRALLTAGLAWADGVGLTRVELQARADNSRALSLYASADFVEEGRRRGFVQDSENMFSDDVLMARYGRRFPLGAVDSSR